MNVRAAEAASPASFQPLKATTIAGARRPSGRLSQIRGCIRFKVHHAWVTIATLRAGQEVDGVFACTRKDRLLSRSGTPYLAVELRDRTGAMQGRAFRDADVLAGPLRARRPRARRRPRRALPRRAAGRAALDRPRARRRGRPRRVPAGRLPRPRRARRLPRAPRARGARPRPEGAAGRAARRRGAARGLAPRAVHAQRPPRLPRRPARAHGGGRHAGDRDVRAASRAWTATC